jgi:protein-tyrosine phosphatase
LGAKAKLFYSVNTILSTLEYKKLEREGRGEGKMMSKQGISIVTASAALLFVIMVVGYLLTGKGKPSSSSDSDSPPKVTDASSKAPLATEKVYRHVDEVIPRLYLGSYKSPEMLLKKLNDAGSTGKLRVLNVRAESDDASIVNSPKVIYKQILIHDDPSVNLGKYFDESNKFIDQGLADGDVVLVHCYAGISRSATLVIAYLMWKYGFTLETTHSMVKARRWQIEPNPGFHSQLHNYGAQLITQ